MQYYLVVLFRPLKKAKVSLPGESMESESYMVVGTHSTTVVAAALAFRIFCQFSTRDVEISDLREAHTHTNQPRL